MYAGRMKAGEPKSLDQYECLAFYLRPSEADPWHTSLGEETGLDPFVIRDYVMICCLRCRYWNKSIRLVGFHGIKSIQWSQSWSYKESAKIFVYTGV